MPRQKRLDWPSIKGDFVEGISQGQSRRWPTYEDLAEKYECNAVNLRKRGAEEQWVNERAMFQRRMEEDRRTQRSHELATLAADLDVNALRIARSGLSVAAARIAELGQQAQQRTLALQAGGDIATAPPPPDSDEMRTLSLSATSWYELGVKALGAEMPSHLIVSGDIDYPVEIDAASRDARTVSIIAILAEAGVITGDHDMDRLARRAGAIEVGEAPHAEDESLHPDEPHDGREPEREAGGLSAA